MNSKQTLWSKILWVVAGIGFLVGLISLVNRMSTGHTDAAYGSYIPWGLWIAAYTMLVGASAGSFALASVIYASKKENWYPLAKISLVVSFATFTAGMLNVTLDLGHPERLLHLYTSTNFFSMMGLMAWFYLAYGILLVAMIYFAWSEKSANLLRVLSYLAIPFAVLFAGAEGALFGVVGARPMWESGLTPIVFLVEGSLTGVSAAVLAGFIFGSLDEQSGKALGKVILILLIALIVIEWAEYSTALYAGIPAKTAAVSAVLFGNFWWVFWLLHLGLGVIVPVLLLSFQPQNKSMVVLSALLITLTALASKLNLVIPALAQEELDGLAAAFSGPGLSFNYLPTATEWGVLVWTISLGVIIFLLGSQMLPRLTKEVK